jgi:hypothetical protein
MLADLTLSKSHFTRHPVNLPAPHSSDWVGRKSIWTNGPIPQKTMGHWENLWAIREKQWAVSEKGTEMSESE